ncbi:MAG: DUF3365 domain-containing protein [Gammaproteobacteria bacterium]
MTDRPSMARSLACVLGLLLPTLAATADDDAALYAAHCGSCHLATTAPRVAPPAHAVQRRYRRAYPERAAFVDAVAAWIAAPTSERALMGHAVERFGVMPPLALEMDERRRIADYLYEAELSPAGHDGADHGRGCGGADGGAGAGRGPGGGHGHGAGRSCAGHGRGDGAGYADCAHERPGSGHAGAVACGGDGATALADDAAALLETGAAAVAPFKQRLMATLSAALAEGAPAAVERCHLEAPALAAASAPAGPRVGRTSDRLRNPDNGAPSWVAPLLAAYVEGRAAPVPRAVAVDAARWGYVEPIVVKPPCLTCHGTALDDAVAAAIRQRYPADRATGYAVGDLRGVFWAELPR